MADQRKLLEELELALLDPAKRSGLTQVLDRSGGQRASRDFLRIASSQRP